MPVMHPPRTGRYRQTLRLERSADCLKMSSSPTDIRAREESHLGLQCGLIQESLHRASLRDIPQALPLSYLHPGCRQSVQSSDGQDQ